MLRCGRGGIVPLWDQSTLEAQKGTVLAAIADCLMGSLTKHLECAVVRVLSSGGHVFRAVRDYLGKGPIATGGSIQSEGGQRPLIAACHHSMSRKKTCWNWRAKRNPATSGISCWGS